MKGKLILITCILFSFTASAQVYKVKDLQVTSSVTLQAKKVVGISNDSNNTLKRPDYLITERAAKRYADLWTTGSSSADSAVFATQFQRDTTRIGVWAGMQSLSDTKKNIADTSGVNGYSKVWQMALKAPLNSPVFSGTPTVPTPSTFDNSLNVANTQWVKLQNYIGASGTNGAAAVPYYNSTGQLITDINGFKYSTDYLQVGKAGFGNTSGIGINGGNGIIYASGWGMQLLIQGGFPTDPSKSLRFANGNYEYNKYFSTGIGDPNQFYQIISSHSYPGQTDYFNFGTAANRWKTVYGKNFYGDTANFTGNVIAGAFYGDGSHLTGISAGAGGVWGGITGLLSAQTDLQTAFNGKENSIGAGTILQYYRGDKTFATLDKTAVGLPNVDNTSDATKNSATATLINKTISGVSNSITNIGQASITNLISDLLAKKAANDTTGPTGFLPLWRYPGEQVTDVLYPFKVDSIGPLHSKYSMEQPFLDSIRATFGASSAWLTAGGDIYRSTGAVLVGASSNPYSGSKLYVAQAALGATNSTNGDFILDNPTAAAVNAQQYMPYFSQYGNGWKTNATAASVRVGWLQGGTITQGAINPSSVYQWISDIGGTKVIRATLGSDGTFAAGANLFASGALKLGLQSRSVFSSAVDGNMMVSNNAATDFSLLQFGGITASFPALKRNAAGLDLKTADDAGFATLQQLYDRFGTGTPEAVITAPVGTIYHRTDGGTGSTIYRKETGTGNTGWVASTSSAGSSQWTTTGSDIYYNTGATIMGAIANPYSAAKLYIAQPSLGATNSTNGDFVLENPTAAVVNGQQYTPYFAVYGNGWKTNTTASSIHTGWLQGATITQGANNPSTTYQWLSDIGGTKVIRLSLGSDGTLTAGGSLYASGTLKLGLQSRSVFTSAVDGNMMVSNNALTDMGLLQLGGTTGSFPALKRNGATIDVKTADDAGFAAVQTLYDRFGSGSPEGVVTAPVSAHYHRTDGAGGTSFYVKESGVGNTGWVAK